MKKKVRLLRILVYIGAACIWLPLITPLIFSIIHLFMTGSLMIDYLMPAELLPMVLVGGVLFTYIAFRIRSHRLIISLSAAGTVLLFLAISVAASLTGLASGANEPEGWRLFLVMSLLAGYIIDVIVLGLGGISLIKHMCSWEAQDHSEAVG